MVQTARKTSRRRQPGRQIDNSPFSPLDPVFYSFILDESQQAVRRLLAQARVAADVEELGSRGMKRMFAPTPMSNGVPAYRLVLMDKERLLKESRDGLLTTQDLKHHVASSELLNKVIHGNRIASHWRGDKLERKFPGHGIIVVGDFEGPIREVRANHALSGGANWQDSIFEAFWVHVVRRSHGTILDGDHSASRNANAEEIEADIIQCGLRDQERAEHGLPPGKLYPIVDDKGRDVSLYDRAFETAKHIFDVVEHGFKTEFAVNALMARFQIHDWLKGPDHGPLDMEAVHPALKNRPQREIDAMDRLKEVMLPYLADRCMGWFPQEGEEYRARYVREEVLPRAGATNGETIAQLREELFSYRPRGGTNEFLHDKYSFSVEDGAEGLSQDFAASSRAVKRRGTDGKHFRDHATLFDDKTRLFDQLEVWEQAGVSFMAASLEVIRTPEAKPTAWFYASHPKGGQRALDWMRENDVPDILEAQGASKHPETDRKSFKRSVIDRNVKQSRTMRRKVENSAGAKAARVSTIMSTQDFLDCGDILERNKEAVAAEGFEKQAVSPDAKLALQMEWFDRNAQGLVLREGWAAHPSEVRMVVRAVQHATGLVNRDEIMPGGTYKMDIMLHDPKAPKGKELKKQSLHDLITSLAAHVEPMMDREPPVSAVAHYVGLARLLKVADMMGDPGPKNFEREQHPLHGRTKAREIIDWGKVDWEFRRFWYENPAKKADLSATLPGQEEPSLRDRLREKLLERVSDTFAPADFENLDEAFEGRQSELAARRGRQHARLNERELTNLKHVYRGG